MLSMARNLELRDARMRNVRYWHIADIFDAEQNVCFRG